MVHFTASLLLDDDASCHWATGVDYTLESVLLAISLLYYILGVYFLCFRIRG